jgi:hypothetical protein
MKFKTELIQPAFLVYKIPVGYWGSRDTDYERFEALTAVNMKSSIFWDITACSPLKVNWRFGGTCRLHLQGPRISRTRNQRERRWQAELSCHLLSLWFLPWLILRPWRWRRHIPPKRLLTLNGLHGFIFQKMESLKLCACFIFIY